MAMRSRDPAVGVPALSAELTDRYGSVVSRARHAGKFLDDTKKSFDNLSDEMADFYAAHRAEFLGHAPRFLRWLETDLGLCLTTSGRVLFSTITGQFRIGLTTDSRLKDAGPLMSAVATEMGQALTLLSTADGSDDPIEGTVNYDAVGRLRDSDRTALNYLGSRYDPAMPMETKLLLLMVEGEITMSELVLPVTARRHEEAAFRARVVRAYHALRAVEGLLMQYPEAQSPGARAVRAFFETVEARRLLDQRAMRQVRNRCMHYEIRDKAMRLDPASPMFGIVEALDPTSSFAKVDEDVRVVTSSLAALLSRW